MDGESESKFEDPSDPHQLQYSNFTTGYEKLLEETSLITERSNTETCNDAQRKNGKTWEFLSKVLFSPKKSDCQGIEVEKGLPGSGERDDSKKKKKKKRKSSSWLPDPDQRWPVQAPLIIQLTTVSDSKAFGKTFSELRLTLDK
ncbi:hypothetical protein QQ045_024386 [Rhodiola kirilowii]